MVKRAGFSYFETILVKSRSNVVGLSCGPQQSEDQSTARSQDRGTDPFGKRKALTDFFRMALEKNSRSSESETYPSIDGSKEQDSENFRSSQKYPQNCEVNSKVFLNRDSFARANIERRELVIKTFEILETDMEVFERFES